MEDKRERVRGGHKRILTCAPVTNCNCLAFSLPAGSRPHYLCLYMASQLILVAGLVRGDWRSGQTVICLWLFLWWNLTARGWASVSVYFTNIKTSFLLILHLRNCFWSWLLCADVRERWLRMYYFNTETVSHISVLYGCNISSACLSGIEMYLPLELSVTGRQTVWCGFPCLWSSPPSPM